MDPKVVTNRAYAATIKNDLLSLPALSIVLKPDDIFGGVNGIYTHSDSSHVGPAWTRACSIELINPDGKDGFQLDCAFHQHRQWRPQITPCSKRQCSAGFLSR